MLIMVTDAISIGLSVHDTHLIPFGIGMRVGMNRFNGEKYH